MSNLAIDHTIDYADLMQTSTSQYYAKKASTPSGKLLSRVADPIGKPYHSHEFYVQGKEINFTLPKKAYELSELEGKALWSALRDSTKTVSKGRLRR